jgi:hypothetical protein
MSNEDDLQPSINQSMNSNSTSSTASNFIITPAIADARSIPIQDNNKQETGVPIIRTNLLD